MDSVRSTLTDLALFFAIIAAAFAPWALALAAGIVLARLILAGDLT